MNTILFKLKDLPGSRECWLFLAAAKSGRDAYHRSKRRQINIPRLGTIPSDGFAPCTYHRWRTTRKRVVRVRIDRKY